MFRRRTATLVATTPASSVATIPIQKTPPVTRRSRLTTRVRDRAGRRLSLRPWLRRPRRPSLDLDSRRVTAPKRTVGFAAVSAALGRIAFRDVERSSGVLPHTHTGKSGGQSHPRSRSRMKRLTIRSSSEWKLITASRPPGRSIAKADGNAASREPSSSLTAMRNAWNTRLAGCPSPKRAGAGMAALIVSTRSPVRSNGCSFLRRAIAFAICRAYRSSP